MERIFNIANLEYSKANCCDKVRSIPMIIKYKDEYRAIIEGSFITPLLISDQMGAPYYSSIKYCPFCGEKISDLETVEIVI